MIDDPTQVPVQVYPYGSGVSPYGPYYGFQYGQRTMTHADMMREARKRARYLDRRADVSEDPSHRYLRPEGRLKGPAGAVLRALKAKKKTPEQKDVVWSTSDADADVATQPIRAVLHQQHLLGYHALIEDPDLL